MLLLISNDNIHKITFEELAMMMTELKDRYERMERLGEGTYGVVFKAKDTVKNMIVALKKIKLEN